MGLAFKRNVLWIGTQNGLQRVTKAVDIDKPSGVDGLFVPRADFITGNLDTHEIAIAKNGNPVFVNTRFSCICRLHPDHNFSVVWKPSFIRALNGGDACHLNGVAMEDGRIRLVTAFAETEQPEGWREVPPESGVLLDLKRDVTYNDFVKPHSPRLYDHALWVLNSGRGYLVRICPVTGERKNIASLPGFARGLSFISYYALITTSLPRGPSKLHQEYGPRDAQCALLIVDIRDGKCVEYVRFIGRTQELFDACIMPGVVCPFYLHSEAKAYSRHITGVPYQRHTVSTS